VRSPKMMRRIAESLSFSILKSPVSPVGLPNYANSKIVLHTRYAVRGRIGFHCQEFFCCVRRFGTGRGRDRKLDQLFTRVRFEEQAWQI